MAIFNLRGLFDSKGFDVARARKSASVSNQLVEQYVERLRQTGLDRATFDAVLYNLTEDARLKAADVTGIAQGYALGKRPKSRDDGIAAIRKRFVELVRLDAKRRNAEKARPW